MLELDPVHGGGGAAGWSGLSSFLIGPSSGNSLTRLTGWTLCGD